MSEENILLDVSDLKMYFQVKRSEPVKAVDGVSFQIRKGETFGLVGESGSGKTTIGRAVIKLYEPTDGKIIFAGQDISKKTDAQMRNFITTKMQMIFQDPMASLNPRKKVMDIIAQGLDIHKMYTSKEEREQKVYDILDCVGLSKEHANRYPHQFSGGQRQRIGIARALIMNPELVIADEAISALDISVQAQVINLMRDIQEKMGTTYLFIAHDLAMVRHISDRVGVLHLGHMVEIGSTKEIFENPIHPYTISLLSAIPHPNPDVERTRKSIPYEYSSGIIDYSKGRLHSVGVDHQVLATDSELESWLVQM